MFLGIWIDGSLLRKQQSTKVDGGELFYDEGMKAKPEYVEGTEAWSRFQSAMKRVVSVPHAEIQRRIEEHREHAAKNPNKRGPKPKSK
jgi:hypothetical protein